MTEQLRRYTFKLYPTKAQAAVLHQQRMMMADLWNASNELCTPDWPVGPQINRACCVEAGLHADRAQDGSIRPDRRSERFPGTSAAWRVCPLDRPRLVTGRRDGQPISCALCRSGASDPRTQSGRRSGYGPCKSGGVHQSRGGVEGHARTCDAPADYESGRCVASIPDHDTGRHIVLPAAAAKTRWTRVRKEAGIYPGPRDTNSLRLPVGRTNAAEKAGRTDPDRPLSLSCFCECYLYGAVSGA